MKKIKVAIVDDHRIIRDGIVALLEEDPEIEITNDFESGTALLQAMKTQKFDLVLLDMHMPEMNGIATSKEIMKEYPNTKILIHTMSEVTTEIEQIVMLGVQGYILKTAGQEELSMAIKTVAHGSSYFSSSVMNSFIKSCIKESEDPFNALSNEEKNILALLSNDELTLNQIAMRLNTDAEQLNIKIRRIKRTLNIDTDFALGKFCAAHIKQLPIQA